MIAEIESNMRNNRINRCFLFILGFNLGERTKTTAHFLQKMQMSQIAQSDTIQEVQGTSSRSGQTSLRQKTTRFWWTN